MGAIFAKVQALARKGEIRISDHGYDELAEDDIFVREIVASVGDALVVEEYADYPKGPCVLVLQKDQDGKPIHVIWGIPKGHPGPAVIVTAYRPNSSLWSRDFLRRIG